jgi:aspartate racemase
MSFDTSNLVARRDVLRLLSMGLLTPAKGTRIGSANAGGQRAQMSLKTIGVLGGLGPQATMDLETRVHKAAQRLIPQHENSGYPPMVVYYHRHPPILLNEDSSPRFPIQPDSRLLDAARRLGAWVDFLVIASNGAHLIQEQIEQAAGRSVLSMISVTLDEVHRRGWRNVAVVGFGDPFVYTKPLVSMKIAFETLDNDSRGLLDEQIMKVMEGRDTAQSADIARDAIGRLRGRRVDGIILGCTEIPLLLRPSATEPDLIDPVELLAEAAVKLAMA